nr:MAG TPA: hypothetical protein [Caudoviricetes sp.]
MNLNNLIFNCYVLFIIYREHKFSRGIKSTIPRIVIYS